MHREAVKKRTPYFPAHARSSREHYPGKKKGERADWNGVTVKLDDNSCAQRAWGQYTGRPVVRKSGYGVRRGHPGDPDAFTAGWNLCYMPFWVGMLTEDQHPHYALQQAVKQASWDLFFADDPVCEPPSFVKDPGFNLAEALREQNIRVIREGKPMAPSAMRGPIDVEDVVRAIRGRQSCSNLQKAVRELLGLPHEPFGTANVAASSKSMVRGMRKQTGVSLHRLKDILDSM